MSTEADILDQAAAERAAEGLKLALPRVPHRGKVGEVRAASTGSSMEIHDFRQYQPGDDLRQLDWNAVARTGELILRVRQDEVSPRIELLVDGSRSMGVTRRKAARTREVALALCRIAARQGLEPVLIIGGHKPERVGSQGAAAALRAQPFDGRDDFDSALRRGPTLRPCGLRIAVSDFLFEVDLTRFFDRLGRGASALALVQVLDPEDLSPSGGYGARLVDVETDDALERILSPSVLRAYQKRLEEHQRLLRAAAGRVRGDLVTVSAAQDIASLMRGPLGVLMEHGANPAALSGRVGR